LAKESASLGLVILMRTSQLGLRVVRSNTLFWKTRCPHTRIHSLILIEIRLFLVRILVMVQIGLLSPQM